MEPESSKRVSKIPPQASFHETPWETAITSGVSWLFRNQKMYPLGDRRVVISLFNVMLHDAPDQSTTLGDVPRETVEKLIKAVFAAGFRIGHTSGSDEATAFEWGWRSREPQDHDAAWKDHVEPWLDPEKPWNFMNIFSPEAWEDVP